jgi:O-antigen ligase
MIKRRKTPEVNIRQYLKRVFATLAIIMFTLWQGSYFPLQFLLMLSLLLIAFILFGNSLNASKEVFMLLGITLLYVVSTLIFSDSLYGGAIEALRTLIFPFTLIFFLNYEHIRMEKAVFTALLLVAIFGLLAFFSIINIPGSVIEHSNRLQSVLQYANTTALLMLLGILYSIHGFLESKSIWKLCSGAIFLTALLLTGTRTTLVVALAVCVLYAFVLTKRRGKVVVAVSAVAAVGVVIALGIFTDIRMFQISIFEATLVERLTTYKDAITMMHGRWYLGIGVGNWQEWQYLYQSAPYSVTHIHNYYLKLLLDAGLAAPLLFCAAIFPAVYRGIREKSVHGMILLAVMMHAVLDFDLVFAAVSMITMYSLSRLIPDAKTLNIGNFRFIAIAPVVYILYMWVSGIRVM